MAILFAAFLTLGAVAGFAQDPTPAPCEDKAGQDALYQKFLDKFPDKSIEGRKIWLATAKQYVAQYTNCSSVESVKTGLDYFNPNIPKWQDTIVKLEIQRDKDALIARFNSGLTSKNWDEVFSAGKELLAKYPDEFRDVELALGTIGFDETYNKNNQKYNDETLKYAKMSIADLEAGKAFGPKFGVPNDFVYKSKDNALGWMNLVVGYLLQVGKKDKAAAAPYLYKATQAESETKTNPIPFGMIGYFYAEQGDKLVDEINVLRKAIDPKDTPEVAKQKDEAIDAKVAMLNGTALRAADAFARAYTLAKDAKYKAEIRKGLDFSYNQRFGKMDGIDAWIATAVKQPFLSPMTPITPITDPDPAKTDATSTVTPPVITTPPPPAKPAMPATTPAAKPVTTPAKPPATAKPQASVKKPAVKKKGA
jgi:hypothetical protein